MIHGIRDELQTLVGLIRGWDFGPTLIPEHRSEMPSGFIENLGDCYPDASFAPNCRLYFCPHVAPSSLLTYLNPEVS